MCHCGSFEVLPHSSVYNYIKECPKLVVVTKPQESSTCVTVSGSFEVHPHSTVSIWECARCILWLFVGCSAVMMDKKIK